MMHLIIRTPREVVFEGAALSVKVPATTGYLEILYRHQAMVAILTAGKVRYTDAAGKSKVFRIKGGVIETCASATVLLTDSMHS